MMKKLLVLMLVLSIASVASANLVISVEGIPDPTGEIILCPSDFAEIDIYGVVPTGMQGGFLCVQGPATMDMSNMTMVYTGNMSFADDLMNVDPEIYAWVESIIGPCQDILYWEFFDSGGLKPEGLDLKDMPLHCEGEGQVLLSLTTGDVVVIDTQLITQVPEPATMLLLGLGGLLLRKRK